jgi:hypothetical protein
MVMIVSQTATVVGFHPVPHKYFAIRRWSVGVLMVLTACGSGAQFGISARPNYTPPPGALNPAVTQATITTTICVSGWTATVRPSTSYTNKLKVTQMKARHLPGSTADYEEDHMVPLELGGAPKDPLNLWPEPRHGPHASAGEKDTLENSLKRQVCAGTVTLDQARVTILDPTKW